MPNVRVVEEVSYGVYVWEVEPGKWIADSDGNFLSGFTDKADPALDQKVRNAITQAAKYYLGDDFKGHPRFLSGHRKVSDEDYENQKRRAAFGLVPDEYDLPALKEELEYEKKYGKRA